MCQMLSCLGHISTITCICIPQKYSIRMESSEIVAKPFSEFRVMKMCDAFVFHL